MPAPPSPRSTFTGYTGANRVLQDIGLSNPNSRITSGYVFDLMKEGQEVVATETWWYHATVTFNTVASMQEYVIPTDTAARCIQVQWLRFNNRTLRPITFDSLYKIVDEWRDDGTGTPTAYYVRGANIIGLYPNPSTVAVVSGEIVAIPPEPAVSETFYVPHGFQDLILIYAALKACEADIAGEPGRRVPVLQKRWDERLQKLKEATNAMHGIDVVVMGYDGQLGYGRPLFRSPDESVGNDG